MSENTNESANPVLTFEGKKYLINELSNDIKESIKGLQIAETQLKMHEDTLKLLSISRNSLANQLREKIALVQQQPFLFSGKIIDVIKMGREYTKKEVIESAKKANAHNFI